MKGFLYDVFLFFFNSVVSRIPLHALRDPLYRWSGIRLEQGASVHMGLKLYAKGKLSIGRCAVIDRDCTLDARGGISIGANVNLAPEVMILTASHDPHCDTWTTTHIRPVVVEDYVWVATRAMILPGVTLGRGCVIGAGAVIAKDVPPMAIVVGNPAKIIGERRSRLQYDLDYRRSFH